jgi:hypothetical protein
MPNQRISELTESGPLYSLDIHSNESYQAAEPIASGEEWYFMTAKPKVSNEKISFSNFKKSILSDAVLLDGDQIISGKKTFTNKCYINNRVNVHSIQDTSEEGPMSGYCLVSSTGRFGSVDINFTGQQTSGEHALRVFGDASFGDLSMGGVLDFDIDYSSTGDATTQTVKILTSGAELSGASAIGDCAFYGDLHVSGEATILGDLNNIDNIYIHNFISGTNQDQIQFEQDQISFSTSGVDFLNINEDSIHIIDKISIGEDNFTTNSNSTASGTIHLEGTGYTKNINTINSGTYRQVYGGDDESMVFKSILRSGYNQYDIELPKSFHEDPVINASLQHVSGGFIIPFIISNVTNDNYSIKFGDNISYENLVVHTTAMSKSEGELSSNKEGIQRFKTPLVSGSNAYVINFPKPHNLNPTISISLEGSNEIIPYTISGVNINNYTLVLSTQTTENYTLHTISTEYDTQRIS